MVLPLMPGLVMRIRRVISSFPVHLHLFAQQGYDRLLYGRMSHNEYHIVLIEHGMSVDYLMVLVAVGTVNL